MCISALVGFLHKTVSEISGSRNGLSVQLPNSCETCAPYWSVQTSCGDQQAFYSVSTEALCLGRNYDHAPQPNAEDQTVCSYTSTLPPEVLKSYRSIKQGATTYTLNTRRPECHFTANIAAVLGRCEVWTEHGGNNLNNIFSSSLPRLAGGWF